MWLPSIKWRTVGRPQRHCSRQANDAGSRTGGLIGLIQNSGAALTVALAITFTFLVALVAIPLAAPSDRVTVATAAFTGIGTIAGAYFGIRVGAEGKRRST